jgi:hypothetical protein
MPSSARKRRNVTPKAMCATEQGNFRKSRLDGQTHQEVMKAGDEEPSQAVLAVRLPFGSERDP